MRIGRPSRAQENLRTCYLWQAQHLTLTIRQSSAFLLVPPILYPLLTGQFSIFCRTQQEGVHLIGHMKTIAPTGALLQGTSQITCLIVCFVSFFSSLCIHWPFLHKGQATSTALSLEIELFFREREVEQGGKEINQLSIEIKTEREWFVFCQQELNKQTKRLICRNGF